MTVTERIRALLDKNGISINKMSKDLHMGSGTFATWEANKRTPNGTALRKIASYFGVSTDYLLTGKEQDSDHPENDVTFDDFTYAMYNESKELSENNKRALLDMARIMREREIKEGKRKADK